jgi:LAO/AO transport system kinase
VARAREEVAALALAALRGRMTRLPGDSALDPLAARVAGGETDPFAAADELLGALTERPPGTEPPADVAGPAATRRPPSR